MQGGGAVVDTGLSAPTRAFPVVGIDVGISNLAMVRIDGQSEKVEEVVHVSLLDDCDEDSSESRDVRAQMRASRLRRCNKQLKVSETLGLLADVLQRREIRAFFSGVRAVAVEQQKQSKNSNQIAVQNGILALLKQQFRLSGGGDVAVLVVPASAVKSFFSGSVFNQSKLHAPGVTKKIRYSMYKKSAVDYAWSFFSYAQRARCRHGKRDDVCDAFLIAIYYMRRVVMRQEKFVFSPPPTSSFAHDDDGDHFAETT